MVLNIDKLEFREKKINKQIKRMRKKIELKTKMSHYRKT